MDKALDVKSPAFEHRKNLPSTYTCDGKKISPPLAVGHIPPEAKSLVLIADDPDAGGGMFVHWIVWNIPVTDHIREDSIPGMEGMNDYGRQHYGPPCPPSGTHRYFFKVYALDKMLTLPASTTKTQLENAMKGHILAQGEIIGLYERRR